MHIVDSQVHLWAADTPDRPWPPGRAAQAQKPYPVTKEMPWLKGEDLESVMGRGVCEWLGWPLPA
jgi:predicted TIM-barrel fold metal-dependent hydrolase